MKNVFYLIALAFIFTAASLTLTKCGAGTVSGTLSIKNIN